MPGSRWTDRVAIIPVCSFSVLVLELTSTRVYSYLGPHNHTSIALSVAMMGLGIGAFLRLRVSCRLISDEIAATLLAISFLGLALAASAGVSTPWFAVGTVVPFLFCGVLISSAYSSMTAGRIRLSYALDLFGAAFACLTVPKILNRVGPVEVLCGLGVLAAIVVALMLRASGRWRSAACGVALAGVGLLLASANERLPDGALDAVLRSQKPIAFTASSKDDIADSLWSSVGRLDLVVFKDAYKEVMLALFTDGFSPTTILKHDMTDSELVRPFRAFLGLGYRVLRPRRVLLLGAGGGASVRIAQETGASRIDAVELNPAVPKILDRWTHFAGPVYHQPGVRLFIADARGFLIANHEHYDLIELALAQTGTAQADHLAEVELNLFTREAMTQYLEHLSQNGAVVFILDTPEATYRQFFTALEVLEARGLSRTEAMDHVALVENEASMRAYRYLLLVGRSALSTIQRERMTAEAKNPHWIPGYPPTGFMRRIANEHLAEVQAELIPDLRPVSDDSPFFFDYAHTLADKLAGLRWLLWVGGMSLVLAFAVIIERTGTKGRSFVRAGLVASSLGLGFMCVELAIVQRFTVVAGGPMEALSFLLFVLLFWCALGNLLWADRLRRADRGLRLACGIAAVAVIITFVLVGEIARFEQISSPDVRRAVLAVSFAPIGLALGTPFPTLLGQRGIYGSDDVGGLWAVNGAASVTGGVLAHALIRLSGATTALMVAGAAYVIGAALAPRARID